VLTFRLNLTLKRITIISLKIHIRHYQAKEFVAYRGKWKKNHWLSGRYIMEGCQPSMITPSRTRTRVVLSVRVERGVLALKPFEGSLVFIVTSRIVFRQLLRVNFV